MSNFYNTKTELSLRERIALNFAAIQDIQQIPINWCEIYAASREKDYTKITMSQTLRNAASTWKCSQRVQTYFTECRDKISAFIEKQVAAKVTDICATSDGQNTPQESNKNVTSKQSVQVVDFAKREEMINALNEIANHTADDKQKLDAIKLISDIQQFKQQAQNKAEIKRFYLPLKCDSCEIYRKRKQIILGKE